MSSNPEPESLFFFDPLKEDNSIGRSGLLQSFLGLFSKKNYYGSSVNAVSSSPRQEPNVSEVVRYKADPSSSYQSDTSTSESGIIVSPGSSPRERSYSAQPFDGTMLQRPASLGLSSVYKMKNPKQGNEVEIKIGGLSTILKDLQKRIAKNNPHSLRDIDQFTPSNSGSKLRQYWMPDKHCRECYECNERFTTFRRRHHCRICGHIFCRRCCYQLISGEIIGYAGMVRSCTYCYNLLMSHGRHQIGNRRNSISAELEGPIEVGHGTTPSNSFLPTDLPSSSTSKSHQHVGRSRSLVSMRGSPVDDHPMPLMSPGPYDMPNWTSAYDMFDATPGLTPVQQSAYEKEQVSFAKSSIQLHDLWVNMTDENTGMEFRDHRIRLRKFSQSFVGTELVDWLLINEVATTRDQASIIGQALLDAEWIKHAADDRENIFYDEDCLYQAGKSSQTNPRHNSSSRMSSSSKSFSTPGHSQLSFDRTAAVDIGSEPTWVREITAEEDEDMSDIEEDVDIPLWGPATPSLRRFFPDSILHFTDEDASSVVSQRSVSSFVEIDNDNSTIKYKRQKQASENGESRKENLSLKEPRFADSRLTDINAEYIRGYLSWHGAYSGNMKFPSNVGWRESDLFDASVPSYAKQAYYTLQKKYFRHSIRFLKQLFQANDLDLSWAEIIVPLAKRISENVIPNCEVNMDVTHYIHIKKLLDGAPKESRMVNGVVFSKNVICAKMRSRIDNPVIMLLATPLEYQRVNYKLASLDPVVRQEPEFFKNLASRILTRHPDIVITQCGVAQRVRRLLLDAGITLLINVKKTVMERLSRCTGADVARSIDQLQNVRLGSCGKFRVQHHYDGKRRFTCSDGAMTASDRLEDGTTSSFKTLSYLDGCKLASGCTVILRDKPDYDHRKHADQHTRHYLARVKSVLRFLVRVLYHCKLELSYVMDQQDLASMSSTTSCQKATPDDQQLPVLDMPPDSEHANGEDPDASSDLRVRSSTYSSMVSDSNTVILEQFDDDNQAVNAEASQSPELWKQTISKAKMDIDAEQLGDEPALHQAQHAPCDLDNFHDTVLSFSPLIKPNIPYLLTEAGKNSPLHQYLPSILFCSRKFSNPADCETGCGSLEQATSSVATDNRLNSDYETDRVSMKNRSSTLDSYSSIQGFWNVPDYNLGSDAELPNASYNDEKTSKKETPSSYKQEGLSQLHSNTYKRMTSQLSGKGEEGFLSSGEINRQNVHDRQSETDRLSNISPKHGRTRSSVNESNQETRRKSSSMDSPVGQTECFEWLPEKHPFLTASFTKPATSTEMRDLLADFRASGSSLKLAAPQRVLSLKEEVTTKRMLSHLTDDVEIISEGKEERPVDCLAANNHQHISVLFSSYSLQSPNAPYPCVIPWAVDIDFYRGLDITLGEFLERYCFRPSYHCTNTSCNRPMVEHVRSFVHGGTCMSIVLKELSKAVHNPSILSWCWNPENKTSTDLKVMSDDAWSMSFAKFLELRLETFTSDRHDEKKKTDDDDIVIPPFRSFQYFLYHDIVAAFKCFEIVVYEVALPSQLIEFHNDTDWQKTAAQVGADGNEPFTTYQRFVASMETLSKVGYESMDQVYDMINGIRTGNPFDQMVGSDAQEPGEDVSLLKSKRETHLDDLLSLYKQERCLLRDTVDNIHLTLQTLRINSTGENTEEPRTKDPNLSSSNNSSPRHSHGTEAPEEQNTPIHNGCGDVPTMSDEARAGLSTDLLKLTCLICRLVDTWNTRMSRITYQDRLSRKGNRSTNTVLYNDQPLPLHNGSHDLYGMKLSAGTQAAVGLTDDSKLSKASDEDGSFSSSATSEKTLHKEFANFEESRRRNKSDDDVGLQQRKSNDGSDATTVPVPIPATLLDRSHSATSSSSKLFARTHSTMTMKSFVSNFLSGFNQTQVAMPFPSEEHYLLPNCICSRIVVRDSEPSSIIAYALCTPDYNVADDAGITSRFNMASSSIDKSNSSQTMKGNPPKRVETASRLVPDDLTLPSVVFSAIPKHQAHSSTSLSVSKSSLLTSPSSSPIPSPPPSPIATSPHNEVQFGDCSTKFYCKIYFANEFKDFRNQILDDSEDQYVASLSRCTRWAASGGKSGSTFHKTLDDRLVLKQMSRFELQSFLQVAQDYLDYVTNAVNKKSPTALSKILGVYSLSFRNSMTSRSFKQDILVMENLFYKRSINRVFDLKGSVRNRHVKTNGETATSSSLPNKSSSAMTIAEDHASSQYDQVLLDENLLTIMREQPLYVRDHTKILIKKALSDDAKFLSSHLIIDYSLLVGIDSDRQEIVVGIIDYLRTFTWDKKIEMVVKSYGMIGRQGTRAMPTVVSPEIYRSRFCEAMDRYFQVVPDRWYGMQAF